MVIFDSFYFCNILMIDHIIIINNLCNKNKLYQNFNNKSICFKLTTQMVVFYINSVDLVFFAIIIV